MFSKFFFILYLAGTLAGETPECSIEAKFAVAQVAQNRIEIGMDGGWYGHRDPEPVDMQVAIVAVLMAEALPDLTEGALYAIGPGDARKMPWLKRLVQHHACGPGDFVQIWQ